jgi:hypothetical protein
MKKANSVLKARFTKLQKFSKPVRLFFNQKIFGV